MVTTSNSKKDLKYNIDLEHAKDISADELFKTLKTSINGLSSEDGKLRLDEYGSNALPEKKISALRQFCSFFWGPIPWMIEIAAILSAVVKHWDDVIIISVLLLFNAVVGFWQEHQAANAIDALKNQLASKPQILL